MLRTFSKVFGLAGLRVGFGIAAPEIITPMMHIKPTWNMGALQVAGAFAALDDDEYVDKTIDAIAEMRAYVMGKLASSTASPWSASPTRTSSCCVSRTARSTSTKVFEELLKRGVIVKDGSVSFIDLGKRYLRIDVSLKKQMDRLIWALTDISNSA